MSFMAGLGPAIHETAVPLSKRLVDTQPKPGKTSQ